MKEKYKIATRQKIKLRNFARQRKRIKIMHTSIVNESVKQRNVETRKRTMIQM